MLECHPILRPFVHATKPVVHAVRHWRPVHRAIHHVHHTVAAHPVATTVMTVCRRIGPILAGGVALLPPASGLPPAGGVGGFPGYVPSEYGAPGFYGPGPYAGPGYGGPGFGGPGFAGGAVLLPTSGVSGPTALASAVPVYFVTPPSSTPPDISQPPVISPPPEIIQPITKPPPTPTPTPPTPNQPPPPGDNTPGGGTATPEPPSLPLLAIAVAVVVGWRIRKTVARDV